MNDFRGRVAVITGAASGMGRTLAQQLGREGASLALIDRDEVGLQKLLQEQTQAGVKAYTATCDVSDRKAVIAAVASLTEQLGPADLLIPCAGVCGFDLVDQFDVDQIERIHRINYLGVVYSIEAVLPGMLARKSGQIVAMASMTAVRGIPFEASYGASKAALVSFLESLRPSLRRRGVQVTLVYPGFVQTPLLDDLMRRGMTKPPGVVDAECAARKILAGARRGRLVVGFPWHLKTLVDLGRLLPSFAYDAIMTRMARQVNLPY